MDFVKRILRTMKRNQQWLMVGAGTVAVTVLSLRLAKKYALDWQNAQLKLLLDEKDREKRYQTANVFTNQMMNKYAVAFRKTLRGYFRERKEKLAAVRTTLTKLEYLNVVKGNSRVAAAAAATPSSIPADFYEKFYSSVFALLIKSVRNLNECLDKDFEKVVHELNIYRELSLKEIDLQFAAYHTKFLHNYSPFDYFNQLFTEKFTNEFADPEPTTVRNTLNEIRDLLASPEVLNIYHGSVRRVDIILIDELYKVQFNSHEITNASNSLTQLNNTRDNFVTYLPKIDTVLKDKQFLNAIITQILNQKNLQTFQKNLFQSYYDN